MFRHIDKFSVGTAVAVFLLHYSALLLLPGFTLLREPDTLWQIRTGQWILEHSQVPVTDSYSYTAFGTRWISGQWLSEIFLAIAFNAAGWRGVVVLTAAACSATVTLLFWYLARHLRFSVAIGWTGLTALALVPHCVARPHVFSYALLVIWVIILLDACDSEKFRPPLLVLSLIMLLWANLHGSFTIGLMLLFVFAGFSLYDKLTHHDYIRCRNILLLLVTISASSLVTPYGIYPALLVLDVMQMNFIQAHGIEWMSPDFQAYPFYAVYLVAIFGLITALGVSLRGARLVAFAAMLILGLSHFRGLFMFLLVAPLLVACPLSQRAVWFRAAQAKADPSSESGGGSDPVLSYLKQRPLAAPVVSCVLIIAVTAHFWNDNVGPPKSIFPSSAINFVQKAGITGNVFNSYDFGGYLIFVGIPTFIDGRIPPHSDDFVRKYFNTVNLRDIAKSFQILDEYNVKWALLEPENPLAKAIAGNPLWSEVYSDNDSAVFVRR